MKSAAIKLYAGLGNQIFQYMYGHYLSKNGTKVKFLQDTKVDDFSSVFVVNKTSLNNCKYIKPNQVHSLILKIYHKYICRNYYTGYYQDKKFALELQSHLNTLIQFSNEKVYKDTEEYKKIVATNSVSVHIRGGDYHNEPDFANICTQEYYKKAIKFIVGKDENSHFFVFTNDKECAKIILKNIENEKITFVNNTKFQKDPGFDLYLMSQCKHTIIANSTFSWWGAFLNVNKEKNVICPKIWINSDPELINKFACADWIKI